ncbi:LytTR family transcriptional regulator [Bacillus anthracis]|nr:LytTR family transcriptional regulator [Bacillus anthracis]
MCKEKECFRATKSTILNIAKITSVHPSFSGRFEAMLDNGERVVISRQYVPVLKKCLDYKKVRYIYEIFRICTKHH